MAEKFAIHALDVGKGQLALAPLPGAEGDLRQDVRSVSDWQAQCVISLTEVEEMRALEVQDLPQVLAVHDIKWMHFPVRDYDVPNGEQVVRWAQIEREVLETFKAEGRVLVHCRGGCGRSGMVALKLMIACGEKPEDALARLRAVRPCAVERDAQMRWATDGLLVRV